MPLDHTNLAARFPWLWHVTSTANADRIARLRRIDSAEALLRAAAHDHLLAVRRREAVTITVDGETVTLRDQAPLHEGHIAWEPSWDMPRFVATLNSRVFFWPGHEHGPSRTAGANAITFLHTRPDAVAVLVPSEAVLVEPEPPLVVELSRFNTGGPRTTSGIKSPRGGSTFVSPALWSGPPSSVRELAVVGSVDLTRCWDRVCVRTAASLGERSLDRGLLP